MRFTLSWLKEYLDTNASVEEISQKLSSIGLEVDELIDNSKTLAPFTVAEIIETARHPDADKLQICKVKASEGEIYQIVCGAANARPGIKIPLARVGVEIPNGNFKIKSAKIRGIESNGMLCSAEELNLAEESEGILELPLNAEIGAPFAQYIGADDVLFDIAITPNRGDCLGVYGVARDLAAASIGTLKPLELKSPTTSFESPIKTAISHPSEQDKLGAWFVGYYVKNITNHTSPEWLVKKLSSIGKKSISAAVDLTNYLTFAFGRPAHVYDADKISGGVLTLTKATDGTTFKALDENEYKLNSKISVIADSTGAQAVAGVIGGLDSSTTSNTKNIFIEVAHFCPVHTANSGRALQIDTDSRYRFERSVDTNSHIFAAHLASLVAEVCGGEVSQPVVAGEFNIPKTKISFPISLTKKRTGLDVTLEQTKEILAKLGFEITSETSDVLEILVPSFRPDISIKEDITEEIIRLIGLDNIPLENVPAPANFNINPFSPFKLRLEDAKKSLSALGLDEVVTFSFTDSKFAEIFTGVSDKNIFLANPISENLNVMRPNIIVNLLDIIAKNQVRGQKSFAYFESGQIFSKQDSNFNNFSTQTISGVFSGLKTEKSALSDADEYSVYNAKQACEAVIAQYMDIATLSVAENDSFKYYHPGRTGVFRLGKNIIAVFGEVNPKILKKYDIKNRVSAFEVFVDNLPKPKSDKITRKPYEVSNLQAVERDFAFLVNASLPAQDILSAVRKIDKTLIENVSIFDIYEGAKLEAGKKSIAFKVRLQPKTETLTDAQIEELSNKVISSVSSLGGQLRSA